jgi:hypothetical protein
LFEQQGRIVLVESLFVPICWQPSNRLQELMAPAIRVHRRSGAGRDDSTDAGVCMDQPSDRQSLPGTVGAPPIQQGKGRRTALLVAAAAALCVLIALAVIALTKGWIFSHRAPTSLQLSGNIEAHESVLSFKAVQSRIVDLPFDEGANVKRGAVIARVDDSDYRQQIAIAEATVTVQQRQLDAAERNRGDAHDSRGAAIPQVTRLTL